MSDFYEVAELKKLLEDSMKAGTVTIISDLPLHEDEKEEYFQTFLDGICLIGEPYPSTVEAMFIEMKIDKIPTTKSDNRREN